VLQQDYADRVLDQAARKICSDAFSNLRLQVPNAWLKAQGQRLGRFRDCSEIFLTAEQYEQIGHPMFEDRPQIFRVLCELWASEAFQELSRKKRNAGTGNSSHKFGADGYRRKAQRYAEYGKEALRRGEDFDWRKEPIGSQAVYASGGGKSHGRYSMFNGMIDSRQVVPPRRSCSQSIGGRQ